MENKKIGKLLIILGIIIVFVPTIAISGLAFTTSTSLGALGSYGFYAFFIIGIIIVIIGEVLRR